MFKNLFVTLAIIPLLLFGNGDVWAAEEEALFVRRIADFWEEGERDLAKGQMEEFIVSYPESAFKDPLANALADLHLGEKNYSLALQYYDLIRDPALKKGTFLNEMQCLYALNEQERLITACEEMLGCKITPDEKQQITYFLAIALYNQALTFQDDDEKLAALAKRIEPHFASLFKMGFSEEIGEAFAHFCSLVKDYKRASELYLERAKEASEGPDELVFQAGLIQAKFDPALALETFQNLANGKGPLAPSASFNWLLLSFEAGNFAEILAQKEAILSQIPEEKQLEAKLFLGRALLATKEYGKAVHELLFFVKECHDKELLRGALLSLLQASFEESQADTFHFALSLLENEFPSDPEIPKYLFSKGQLEKKEGNLGAARDTFERLLERAPHFSQKTETLFELVVLDYETGRFERAAVGAEQFLSLYPDHSLSPFMWRYLASATSTLAMTDPKRKGKLAEILAEVLKRPALFSPAEKSDWQFLFAKVQFDLKSYDKAMNTLEPLLADESEFPQKANAILLLSLCERDGAQDLTRFCSLAEKALELGADLIDLGSLHTSLFNAYLSQESLLPAADHLFFAFEANAKIQKENLLWLVDTYASQGEIYAERLVLLLEAMIQDKIGTPENEIQLAKAYLILGKAERAVSLLEAKTQKEAKLLLGEALLALGEEQKALRLFDEIVAASPNVRSLVSATASLKSLKIRANLPLASGDTRILLGLKNLMLQKSLPNEPIHLEAALTYAELQNQEASPEKRCALWEKLKSDFEKTDDLLSKDYHEAKSHFPAQYLLVQHYLSLMEAEILLAQSEMTQQKELQIKGKALLLKIMEAKPDPTLALRVKNRLRSLSAQE